jgi:hypothetical protein
LVQTLFKIVFEICAYLKFQVFANFDLCKAIPNFEIELVGLVANDQRHTKVVVEFQK